EAEPPEHWDDRLGDAVDVRLLHRLLPHFHQFFFDFLAGGCNDLFDAGGVDPAILDELFEADPRDFTANWIEAAHHHHAGRVIDDPVPAGRLLEAADVPAFAADHAALHVVAGDRHRADCVIRRLLGSVTLDRLQNDLARLLLGLILRLLGDPRDDRPR